MRILYFLILINVFTSCDHPKKPYIEELTWPKRTVKLDNGVGTLTIRLPQEFDTFYKFEDYSDHSCGDLMKYRFQKSSFPKSMERGMLRYLADSLYYFTIDHNLKPDCDPPPSYVFNPSHLENYIEKLKADDSLDKLKIQISKIDSFLGNKYSILAYENGIIFNLKEEVTNLNTSRLTAATYIKNQLLFFEFECAASNCDSFIPKMYKALKTVEIKPN